MNFLKRFFLKEKKEHKKEKVVLTALDSWFNSAMKSQLSDIKQQFASIFSDIKKEHAELQKNLDELEDMKLMNESVPLKEIHFMEGNRASYIKKSRDFLEKIRSNPTISISELKDFIEDYEKELVGFTKSSYRPFQILKNFFGEKMDEIAEKLKAIDENMKHLSALANSETISLIAETKESIKEMVALNEKINSIALQIEEEEKIYRQLDAQKKIQEQKIDALKNNPRFLELNRLKAALKETEEQLKKTRDSFTDDFLQMEKALKKFSRSTVPLVDEYLENPVNAILKDSEFEIVNILEKVKASLEKNELDIEDKKKGKIIEKINETNKESLLRFILKHNDLELRRASIATKINQNNSIGELNDMNYRLEHTLQKQKQCTERIKKLNQQMERLNFDELKKTIESNLRILGHYIEIEVLPSESQEM